MSETEYSVDVQRQVRIACVDMAVRALKDTAWEDGDVTKLAKEIYDFINGETK